MGHHTRNLLTTSVLKPQRLRDQGCPAHSSLLPRIPPPFQIIQIKTKSFSGTYHGLYNLGQFPPFYLSECILYHFFPGQLWPDWPHCCTRNISEMLLQVCTLFVYFNALPQDPWLVPLPSSIFCSFSVRPTLFNLMIKLALVIKLGVQPWIKPKFRAIEIGYAEYKMKFDSTKSL